MFDRRLTALLLVVLTACAPSAARPAAAPAPAIAVAVAESQQEAALSITATDMYARVSFLASDALLGRDTPSQGLEVAAAYIESEMRRFGLEPAGNNNTFLQRYAFPVTQLRQEGVRMAFTSARRDIVLRHGIDFVADRGAPGEATGGMVFIGEVNDALQSVPGEVRERIAVAYLPGSYDRDWRLNVTRARRIVQDGGGRAVIFIVDPSFTAQDMAMNRQRFAAAAGRLGGLADVATYFVTYESGRDLFRAAELDLDGLRARRGGDAQRPVPVTGVTATLAAPSQTLLDGRPANVVGLLRGSDPSLRDSYVVISAHYDHVGVGTPDARGDSIYNGADDNASGTSALLEIAEAFSRMATPPRRSILFLAVSGEEKGLLGSRYFSDNPTVPVERIVANVNIDMISRNAPDSIVVLGQEYSSLGPLVQRVNARQAGLGLTVAEDLWPEERFFFRSDHFNFARLEIPAIFFFAGVHEDYHRPGDRVELIDPDKGARVSRLIFHTIAEIANETEPPRWTDEGLEEVRRLTR